jgi:ribbon-helix-helix protein
MVHGCIQEGRCDGIDWIGEDHDQYGPGGSRADWPAGAGGLLSEPHWLNPHGAIRNQLSTHSEAVKQTVVRKELVLGLQHYTRRDLEALRAAGEALDIRVLGLVSITDDVSPELALETIASLEVLGSFRASLAVKTALASRIWST